MIYELVHQKYPINILSPNFKQLKEDFKSSANYPFIYAQAGSASIDYSPGKASITFSSNDKFIITNSYAEAPFCTCIMEVLSDTSSGSGNFIGCGIYQNGSNRITAFYDKNAGNLKISSVIGGTQTLHTGQSITLTAPYKIALVVNQNIATVMVDQGSGLEHKGSFNLSGVELSLKSTWVKWKYYMAFGGGSGTVTIDDFEAGYFGEIGIANQYAVKYENGELMKDGDKIFLFSTSGGFEQTVSGQGFRQLHSSIYSFDTKTYELECLSKIFIDRNSRIYGDIGGSIIYDRDSSVWRIFLQNTGQWGQVTATVYHSTSSEDLLRGVHIISDMNELIVPGGTPYWDVDVIKIDGEWYIAYNNGSFNFLLAKGYDFNSLSQVGSTISTGAMGEGARFFKYNGRNYVLWGTLTGGIRYFDLEMNDLGTIIPNPWELVLGPPMHPAFIPYKTEDSDCFITTFNQQPRYSGMAASYGKFLVYKGKGLSFP